jgi:hypothetical protein
MFLIDERQWIGQMVLQTYKNWNFNNLILKTHTQAQIWSNQSIVLKNIFNAFLKWQMISYNNETHYTQYPCLGRQGQQTSNFPWK